MRSVEIKNEEGWTCNKCKVALEPGKAHITYMKSTISAELLTCPICKEIFVPEDLAMGKMLEVEKMLEEK